MNHDKKADVLKLIGRILMSIIFLASGWNKLMNFAGTVAFTGTVLPFPEVMVVAAIIIEIVGGLFLLFGYQTKIAVSALILFTVVAAFSFHFDLADQAQTVHLMKNLAIVGGLLYMKVGGSGKYSIGAKKRTRQEESASV